MSAPVEKKQEADLSPEVESLLPQAESLAKSGKLTEALEKISGLEKKARNAADLASTTRLLLFSLSLIRQSPSPTNCDWDLLCETIVSLSKKHGQLKQAITRMVQQAFFYLHEPGWDPTPNVTKKDQKKEQEKDEEMKDVEDSSKKESEPKKKEEETKDGKKVKKLIGQGKKHQPTEKEIEEEEKKMTEERQGKESVEITRLNEEARQIGNTGMNEEQRLKLIECLRNVTEGKIFVEVERARVTKLLSEILFAKGEVSKAADILQELAVETFGSMSRREKTEFIIEQMRLNAERKDWNRVAIVAKKINERFFKEEGQEDLKLLYYDLMIRYALTESKYLDVCKYHREIFNTPSIKADPAKSKEVLRNVVVFCVLAPYDNEQNDLMHRIESEGDVEKDANEEHKNLLTCFTTPELMRWPGIDSLYSPILRSTPTFSEKTEDGKKRWEELHKRVVEHNIRVISLYYTRITIPRLSELLDLPADQAETSLADLVVSGTVYAKIDRPAGVVSFAPKTSDSDKLNSWSGDMQKLLDYVETTSHLIHREMAVVRAGLTVKD